MDRKQIAQLKQFIDHYSVTDHQREVIVGTLLGDANLQTQNGGRTYRYRFWQSNKHRDYMFHVYSILKTFFSKEPRFLERRSIWEMETVSHHMWNEYAQVFYPDGTKEVPSDIWLEQWLTPRAIAYWYMDDGGIATPNRKATSLNSHGFSLEDNSRLVRFLQKKYGLNTWIKFNKKRPMIMISGHSFEKMSELVLPFIIPSMHYKFPGPRLRGKSS